MARDITQLEPAERDPAKLRRTGWSIAIVMMVGGVIIMGAYLIKLRGEDKTYRPPILAKLKHNFLGRDQHNKAFGMSQLEGKLSLVTPIAGKEKARLAETLRVMKMVAEKYSEDDDLRFVGVTVDPENDGPAELQEMLKELGVGEDSRWFFVQAEEANARNYLKQELRLDTAEIITVGGKKTKRFLSLLAVVDGYLHLRQQYDFNKSREVQDDARRILKEDSAQAERLKAADRTEEVQAAEAHLLRALEAIRSEKLEAEETRS